MSVRVSIVTIAFNEAANIVRTLESVWAQTYSNLEYIVKDGGSNDGTVEKIKAFDARVKGEGREGFALKWVSERDGGIYDAMNRGLALCTGDYVLFCNAGDALFSAEVIARLVEIAEHSNGPDLVYGDSATNINGQLMVRTARGPKFMRFGMPASHEAMMYKLSVVQRLGLQYDTSYQIAADYKFTYQFVNAAKSVAAVRLPIVIFSEGGVSTSNMWKGLKEACRARREVGELSFMQRTFVRIAQSAALILAIYAKPAYRFIRLKRNTQ